MSDNVPLRIQESCVDDDYYMVDIFSYVRPATIGGTGSRHQLAMYVTRASEDSGRLNILQVRKIHQKSQPVRQSIGPLTSQTFWKLASLTNSHPTN